MCDPRVSVLLLTRDGMAHLPAVLDAVSAQQSALALEIVALDSGSRDGTLELLRRRLDRLEQIPPGAFDHGLTRNRGVALCRGELVVILAQDAVPADSGWLEALARPLLEDARLAGTFARQVPRPGASAVTVRNLARWVAARQAPHRSALGSAEELLALDPRARLWACAFDNVCSCIRRAVWQRHPFARAPIAEDLAWGKTVLLAGHQLAYVPEAVVVHSHDRPASYELKRTYLVHRELFELFGLRTIPTAHHLLRAMAATLVTHLRWTARGPRGDRPLPAELARAVGLAIAWPLGQYLGARAAERGRPRRRLRGV